MILVDSPLQRAMTANGTEAGPEPVGLGADAWTAGLAELPLEFQPGEGWRYHHSFGLLGVLISRVTGRTAGEYLADALFAPLRMADTGFWVPVDQLTRLPAAYRLEEDGLVETEPAGVASTPAGRPSTSATPSWCRRQRTTSASSGCSSVARRRSTVSACCRWSTPR